MFNRRDVYVTTPKRKLNIKISMRLIENEYAYFKLLRTFKVVRIWFYDRLNIDRQNLYVNSYPLYCICMSILDVYFTNANRYYAYWWRTSKYPNKKILCEKYFEENTTKFVSLYIYTLLRYRNDFILHLGKRWVPVDIPITTLKPEHSGKRGRNVASGNIDVARDGKLIGNL